MPRHSSAAGAAGQHRWDFGAVNDLIERHNRFYPIESRLPMDVRRRDYALVERPAVPARPARCRLDPRAFPGGACRCGAVSLGRLSAASVDRLAGVQVEELQPLRLHRHLDLLAAAGRGCGVEARDERGALDP